MSKIDSYLRGGRIPWAPGYSKYKQQFIEQTLADPALMRRFAETQPLPPGFGARLDERVVEYPWALTRLGGGGVILDAGSTFSNPFLLESPYLKGRDLIIYTMMTDWVGHYPTVSYIFGDFRDLILKDECVDVISCISTLEHVGLNYDYKTYTIDNHWPQQDLTAYRQTLAQFHRVLKPGGRFLLTMPFGRYENHGWLQQHDSDSLDAVIAAWPGRLTAETVYRYDAAGWALSDRAACAEARYWNIHHTPTPDPDGAAAARAVACLEFVR